MPRHLVRIVRFAVTRSWMFAALVCASMTIANPASAQLGRLKKMAADAAKDAVGKKLEGGKDSTSKPAAPAASTGASGAAAPTAPASKATPSESAAASSAPPASSSAARTRRVVAVTPENIDIVLGGIDAIMATPRYQWESRRAAFNSCAEGAMKAMKAMKAPTAAAQKNADAVQKRIDAMDMTAVIGDERRTKAYLDTMQVLNMQVMALTLGANCGAPPFQPLSVLDEDIKRESTDASYEIPATARGGLTLREFGTLRERMALWALIQSKTLNASDVKFTDAETAAFMSRAEKMKTYLAYLNSKALLQWSDLRNW